MLRIVPFGFVVAILFVSFIQTATVFAANPYGIFGGVDAPIKYTADGKPYVGGWAYDPARPGTSIPVQVYTTPVGGVRTLVTTFTANLDSGDLITEQGLQSGNYRYRYAIPEQYYGTTQVWEARALNASGQSFTLQYAPRTLTVPKITVATSPTAIPPVPTISPVTGTYSSQQTVTISSAGAASIRYVLDTVSALSCASGNVYTGSFSVSTLTVVRAIACNSAGQASAEKWGVYMFSTAPTSIPTPTGLTHACSATGNSVTLSWGGVSGATSYLPRLDDRSNNTTSCVDGWNCAGTSDYAGSVTTNSVTRTVVPGRQYSWWVHSVTPSGTSAAVSGTVFQCNSSTVLVPPAPTASVPSGTYTSAQSVALTSLGATAIRYALDTTSTLSCTAGTLYSAPITISSTKTLRAIGCNSAGQASPVTTRTYTINTATSCTLDGVTLLSGQTKPFYKSRTVLPGQQCSFIGQNKTCSSGTLSGAPSYKYATCAPSGPASPLNLAPDTSFQNGIDIWSPIQGGGGVVTDTLTPFGVGNGKPVWHIGQWATDYDFGEATEVKNADGSVTYENENKRLIVGPGNRNVLKLDKRPESGKGFFQISSRFSYVSASANQYSIGGAESIRLKAKVKLTSIAGDTTGSSNATAHYTLTLMIANLNNLITLPSEKTGMYFQVPLYDIRTPFETPSCRLDVNSKYMCGPNASALYSPSLHTGQWVTIDVDVLPHIKNTLLSGWNGGMVVGSRSYDDYAITGIPMGWEITSNTMAELEIKDLELIYTPKAPTALSGTTNTANISAVAESLEALKNLLKNYYTQITK